MLAWQLTPPRIRRPLLTIGVFIGRFVLSWLSSAAVAWLREQFGSVAFLSAAMTVAFSTAIPLYAMWLLLHRAKHQGELIWLYVISRLVTGAAFLNATLWSRRLERSGDSSTSLT